MAARRSPRSGSGAPGLWVMSLVLVLLAGGGITGSLWATGYFDTRPISRDGQIALSSARFAGRRLSNCCRR